jgi:hypothetical protein
VSTKKNLGALNPGSDFPCKNQIQTVSDLLSKTRAKYKAADWSSGELLSHPDTLGLLLLVTSTGFQFYVIFPKTCKKPQMVSD